MRKTVTCVERQQDTGDMSDEDRTARFARLKAAAIANAEANRLSERPRHWPWLRLNDSVSSMSNVETHDNIIVDTNLIVAFPPGLFGWLRGKH